MAYAPYQLPTLEDLLRQQNSLPGLPGVQPRQPVGLPGQTPQLPPESPDDSSLLNSLASNGGSALQWIGESLDKTFGGRTVRGLLGGEGLSSLAHLIPFSDTLGLTDNGLLGHHLLANKEDVPTGKQLLEKAGVLDQNSEGVLPFVAGMGADIALDPATYLLGPLGHALGPEGKALEAAGALPKVGREAGTLNLLKDAAGHTLGPRVTNMTTNFADHVGSLDPAIQDAVRTAAEKKYGAGAFDTMMQSNNPLGGLMGTHVPFTNALDSAFGSGNIAQGIASGMDRLGEFARYNPLTRAAAGLFQKSSGDRFSKAGQIASAESKAAQTTAQAAGRAAIAGHLQTLDNAGFSAADKASLLRDVFEGVPAAAGGMQLPANAPPEVIQAIQGIKDELGRMPSAERAVGLPGAEWASPHGTGYFPREASETGASGGRGAGSLAGEAFDPTTRGRESIFDLPGASNAVNELTLRPELRGANRTITAATPEGANALAQDFILNAKRATGEPFMPHYSATVPDPVTGLPKQYVGNAGFDELKLKVIPDLEKQLAQAQKQIVATGADPQTLKPLEDALAAHQDALASLQAVQKQAGGLADYIGKMSPHVGAETAPLFGNNPLYDLQRRVSNHARATAAAESSLQFLGKNSVPAGEGTVPIADVVKNTLMSGNTLHNTVPPLPPEEAMDVVTKAAGKTVADFNSLHIPQEIADAVTSANKTFQSPEAWRQVLKVVDGFTNKFKELNSIPWPANRVRNVLQGVVTDSINGIDPITSAGWKGQMVKLVGGQETSGLAKLFPGKTEAEAAQEFSKLAYAHGVTEGSYLSKDLGGAARTGAIQQQVEKTFPNKFGETLGGVGKAALPDVVTGAKSEPGWLGSFVPEGVRKYLPHPVNAGREAESLIDDTNRLSSFAGLLDKGMTPAEAAARVKAMHGDYGNLSAFEKSTVKRLIPFYNWSRQIIPTFVDDLLKHPGGVTAQSARAATRLRDDSGFLPEQLSTTLAVPLGDEQNGTRKFLSDSGINPIEALNDLIRPSSTLLGSLKRTGESLLGQTNPLIKGPLELATGKQFYSDRNLADLYSRTGNSLVDQVMMNSPGAKTLSTLGRLTDDRKSLGEKLLGLTTPLRTVDIDLNKNRDIAARDAIAEQLTGRGGRMSENFYVPKDVLAGMSPEDQKLALLYSGLQKRAAGRAKEAKAAP